MNLMLGGKINYMREKHTAAHKSLWAQKYTNIFTQVSTAAAYLAQCLCTPVIPAGFTM